MYNPDRAIKNIQQDRLGRSSFSKRLGQAIYGYTGAEGLVIGLYGKWGTGKTSVINMAMQELKEISEKDKKDAIIIKFSPWNYCDKNDLIALFFECLKSNLNTNKSEVIKKNIGKLLENYADIFEGVEHIPVIGKSIFGGSKLFARFCSKKILNQESLEEAKEKLEKALVAQNHKIVVVIDDIDRLTNSQIRDVFQLVKQVADFPNIIYILSMDREVVCRALEEVHKYNGDEYLEKIVQIPFEIPYLNRKSVQNILFAKLNGVIEENGATVDINKAYWKVVYEKCVDPFIHTLRDVNRIINAFQFKYSMLAKETCIEDLIALTTISVLDPKLYEWIAEHKDILCGTGLYYFERLRENSENKRKLYLENFEKNGIESVRALACVATLFPVFADAVNETSIYDPDNGVQTRMRVAHSEHFELYFKLDLTDIPISRTTINECINSFNEKQLVEMINKIDTDGNISYFVDELNALINTVSQKRLKVILRCLYKMQYRLSEVSENEIFIFSKIDKFEACGKVLLKKIDSEQERYNILKDLVKNGDLYQLGAVCAELNSIEKAYGRHNLEQESDQEKIISKEQLGKIEVTFLERVHKIIEELDNVEENAYSNIIALWELIEPEKKHEYIRMYIANKKNHLRYICKTAGAWKSSGENEGWQFNALSNDKYTTPNIAKDILDNYDKKQLVRDFTDQELLKLATLLLELEKGERHVTKEEASQLVLKWKCD